MKKLLNLMAILFLICQNAHASNLLFSSGFETGVSVTTPSNSGSVWTGDIQGSDNGYDWNDLPGTTGTFVQFLIETADVTTLEDFDTYIDYDIETVTGPSGSSTKAWNMHNLKHYTNGAPYYTGQRVSTNNTADKNGPDYNNHEEYTLRYWMKFNDDFETSMVSGSWYLWWETVVNGNTNKIFIKNTGSGLFWQFENGYNDGTTNNTSFAVPLQTWFLVDLYYKHADDSTGRFTLKINGVEVIAYEGPTCTSGGVNATNFLKSYSNKANVGHWVDDFEIWDGVYEEPTGPPSLSVAMTDSDIGEPSNDGSFTISCDGCTGGEYVHYSYSGTADYTDDFIDDDAQQNFIASGFPVVVAIEVQDDLDYEGSESATVTLYDAVGADIDTENNTATFTITDNESAPVSSGGPSASFGGTSGPSVTLGTGPSVTQNNN